MDVATVEKGVSVCSHNQRETSEIPALDPIDERRVMRKVDFCILPALFIIYISCFIDRAAIGNVKVANMPEDIHASEAQFSTAISIFYATYILVEIPAVLLVKRFSPRRAMFLPCLLWTAATISNGFVTSVGGLYACRLVLGAAEGGLFPSLSLYLTLVYDRGEIAKRVSYLVSCSALSGCIGGLMAYGILQMDGVGGYAAWRWVYIIFGACSFVSVFAVLFGMPRDIRGARFLSEGERKMMQLRHERRLAYMGEDEFSWEEVRLAFSDVKVWLNATTMLFQNIPTFGVSTFLPAMLHSMGHDALASNYLTVPIYFLGAAVFIFLAFMSDKYAICGPILLATNATGIAGFTILLAAHNESILYFAFFLVAISTVNGFGMNIAWFNVNMAPQYRRATAIGIQQTLGNMAGVFAGQIFRKSPYVLGKAFSLGCLGIASVLVGSQMVFLWAQNREKALILAGERVDGRRIRTGDYALEFKYRI